MLDPSSTDVPSGDPAARLAAILSTAEGGDVLERLRAAGLVDTRTDRPERDVTAELQDQQQADEGAQLDAAAAIGRVDPRQSRAVLDGGRRLGMYVAECYINTEAEPAYHRLPSFRTHNPYHIVYLMGFAPGEFHTVLVTLQVFSAGTVTISGAGTAATLTLGQSSVPLTVPVGVTTTAEGFASIFIQRNGETGFDWLSAEVL